MTLQITTVSDQCQSILDQLDQALVGKRAVCRLVLLGILASGHVLIEDLPGVGKTLLARGMAGALGLRFSRVQFTPDLLPSDLTGASIYHQGTGEFVFREGPVFTNLLLADEINRTPPKTQAAMLEAMAEGQVSADGRTRQLPDPFIVLATDNPIDYEGTYPLPEAQLDRFMLRVHLGYLSPEGEVDMVRRRIVRGDPGLPSVTQVCDAADLLLMRKGLEQVECSDEVIAYAAAVVAATRDHPQVTVGASPRGTLALVQLARAAALLEGRAFAIPEDVKTLGPAVLAHRIGLRPEVWVRRVDPEEIILDVLDQVPVPRTESSP